MEEWKDVFGFEGKYLVSSSGVVWSVKRRHRIVPFVNSCGYEQVHLFRKRGQESYYVHRLVAEHFVDGYADGKEVNHIDGNKRNNSSNNLEWVTRSENQKHAFNVLHPGCHRVKRKRTCWKKL